VVCGLGNDSGRIAEYLNENGYQAKSLRGGMTAWMEMTVVRELPAPPSLDRLVQFDRIGKGALGYLLLSNGEAFVVDPPRHTVKFLETIDAAGATLVGVADTHAHADYISGAHSLAILNDVPYYLHAADAVYPYDGRPGTVPHQPVEDNEVIRVGRAEIRVRHTPGHTEGSVSFTLDDDLALTGDFIFIGSVGRPDLGGRTEEWTPVLHASLARAKKNWPPTIRILPAHYASGDERNEDHTVDRALGECLAHNVPLALADAQAFNDWVMARAGSFPEVYRRIKAINLGLETVDEAEAEELEAGKNQCALG